MLPAILDGIVNAKQSIAGWQQCFDHPEVCGALIQRLQSRVALRLILNCNQLKGPSCANQLEGLITLQLWGTVLRAHSSAGRRLAQIHAKAWFIDEGDDGAEF
jgi:hypothetical protein